MNKSDKRELKNDFPPSNQRLLMLVNHFSNGNVADFVELIKLGKHQNFNRIFNIDKRNGKYPSIPAEVLNCIQLNLKDVNYDWLLTGNGRMLNKQDTAPSANFDGIGVPYYNVDFIGGFGVLIDHNNSIKPTCHILFPQYERVEMWVDVTGDSMSPVINSGDKIAIRQIEDWNTYIQPGQIYGIVTKEYRTIKYVRKSKKGDDFYCLVPENKTDHDEIDLPKDAVLAVFKVVGCAKMFE